MLFSMYYLLYPCMSQTFHARISLSYRMSSCYVPPPHVWLPIPCPHIIHALYMAVVPKRRLPCYSACCLYPIHVCRTSMHIYRSGMTWQHVMLVPHAHRASLPLPHVTHILYIDVMHKRAAPCYLACFVYSIHVCCIRTMHIYRFHITCQHVIYYQRMFGFPSPTLI